VARERTYAQSDPTWSDGGDAVPSGEWPGPVRPGVEITFHRDGNTIGLATGQLTDTTFDDNDPQSNRVTTPYHVWLTRAEVNKVIRDLRRARNVAFGADE